MSVTDTLAQRAEAHGDFTDNGVVMQGFKELMREQRGWKSLSPHQREALDMITNKISRILCGDPNFRDHWHDIQGYAKLVEERL